MRNGFGNNYRFEIFGESHGPEIGVTIEGLPKGIEIDMRSLGTFLDRRAPGRKDGVSARYEEDMPEFRSGVTEDNITTGEPITVVIENKDVRSEDYEEFKHIPRPGHADFPAMVRTGSTEIPIGGGPYSGRMTAPLCIAGGIAMQMLEERGIKIHAQAISIEGRKERSAMMMAISNAIDSGDSVGGIIQCRADGLPIGIGEPMFEGMENKIAQAVFAVPAIKGIEFGDGFVSADRRGSENNDAFYVRKDALGPEDVYMKTNHSGGILGGMTSGMPLIFRVAVKPTPSIAKEQHSVNMETLTPTMLSVGGRHDACIVLRAVPCIEAAAAVAIYDLLLDWEYDQAYRAGHPKFD